jgi:hypothetical protein
MDFFTTANAGNGQDALTAYKYIMLQLDTSAWVFLQAEVVLFLEKLIYKHHNACGL